MSAKLNQIEPIMTCGHARRYIYSANERAKITTSTCIMCALQSANARIAELERERDAMRELFKRANEAKRIALYNLSMMSTLADNYRAERDAALAAKAQAEADARAFAELLDGGKWSPPFRARWTKYLEAK